MEGVSYFTGLMQPYLEPIEDRETIDRRLNAFRKLKPPSFNGSYDLTVAARWLQALDKIFRVMQCVDAQKLIYFSYDAQERKQGEFERLVQGSMTIDEYVVKFNELAKFAHFRIAMPTPQYRDIEDICVVSKAKKAKVSEVKGAGSSTSWRDRKFGGKGKGKQLSARQAPNQFKRTSTQGSAARSPITPRCTRCGRSYVGPCATVQIICFHCGKEGHYARDYPSSAIRAAAVLAIPLQIIPTAPRAAPVVPPATGRVYTLDRQQSDRAPNLVRGTISIHILAVDVLFDSGATHSFIATSIVVGLELLISVLSPRLRFTTATREKCDTTAVHHDVVFQWDGRDYSVNLIGLPMDNLEIILRMDLLFRNCVMIDCCAKKAVMSPCDSTASSSPYISVL
ncbi:uncharacterized protein LOC133309303 [Gastrolobium bilobum]|uniref:uncharacterized protein LOC133309303 n=1 Tax=Gastrolobium bilobum TaxID=150636 RepID=UPI002AB13F97|nr:uncharacterized protein LOC133309303 [Gastrolobium bilobum]